MNPTSSLRFTPIAAVVAASLALGTACSSTDGVGAKTEGGPEKRDTAMTHEPCDGNSSGAVKVDVKGDGKPDIIHVMSGGREVCRIVDLNHDGVVDAYIYYDEQGRERRRESDFDRDGRADEIALSKNGKLYLKLRETNFDNKIDTWDYYENDRLVRRERDSDGDGVVDQWWTFNNLQNPKCATVATDRGSTGKPDPKSVVDLCADEYGSTPAKTAGSAAPSAAAAVPPPPVPPPPVPPPPVPPAPGASVQLSAKPVAVPVVAPPKK